MRCSVLKAVLSSLHSAGKSLAGISVPCYSQCRPWSRADGYSLITADLLRTSLRTRCHRPPIVGDFTITSGVLYWQAYGHCELVILHTRWPTFEFINRIWCRGYLLYNRLSCRQRHCCAIFAYNTVKYHPLWANVMCNKGKCDVQMWCAIKANVVWCA